MTGKEKLIETIKNMTNDEIAEDKLLGNLACKLAYDGRTWDNCVKRDCYKCITNYLEKEV